MYIFRFCVCFATSGDLCIRAEKHFSRFPIRWEHKPLLIQHSDSGLQCYCDEVSPKRQNGAAVCEGTEDRNPLFPPFFFFDGGRNRFSILCLPTPCPAPAGIEALCICERLSNNLQRWRSPPSWIFLSPFTQGKSKGRVGSARWLHIQTRLCRDTNKLILGAPPPPDNKVTVGHLVYVTNLLWRSCSGPSSVVWGLCVAVVPSVCVSLLASRPWWVAVLNSWK